MSLGQYKDLCMDAADAGVLADFWGTTLRRDVRLLDDGDAVITGATTQQAIWFNTVPEPKTVKHRMHLDLHVASIDDLVAAGATVLDGDSFRWTVMADPEGGEFCAFVRENRTGADLYELVLDCADPPRMAQWWAELLGGRVGDDAEEPYVDQIPGAPFENLVLGWVPEPKTAKNRVHLDITTPDVGALVAAGATVLAELDSWTVLADPEGNEFCAFPGT